MVGLIISVYLFVFCDMDLENYSPNSISFVKCNDCGSPSINRSLSGTSLRSAKRKNARVEIENEVDVLRETLGNQQVTIQDLNIELEEERDASSSAANEAMSMILRLQSEKAEIQMEARQFKRFAEEKNAHDQQEILALEDLLYKREQTIQSLTFEIQAYKHRLMSYGFTESDADNGGSPCSNNNNTFDADSNNNNSQVDFPASYDYPPLKCNFNGNHNYSDQDYEVEYDVEKPAFGDLEFRINQLEKTPKSIKQEGDLFCPRRSIHLRKFSSDSAGTLQKETVFTDSPKFRGTTDYQQKEELSSLRKIDITSEIEDDDASDRVYTIDSVHDNSVVEPNAEDHVVTTGDKEIKKLYMRLQTLEADRESMKQTLISMRTDKAQFVLLKEIAQRLCKEMPPPRRAPMAKPSLVGVFSMMSILKWVISFLFWRKKDRRCRYMFGLPPHHKGLLMVLYKGPHIGQWRCLSSINL